MRKLEFYFIIPVPELTCMFTKAFLPDEGQLIAQHTTNVGFIEVETEKTNERTES